MARRFAGRIRRGVTGTAAAAAAMAALTASLPTSPGGLASSSAGKVNRQPDLGISGDTSYYTALPPLAARGTPVLSTQPGSAVIIEAGGGAVPATVLDAYRKTEAALATSAPHCDLRWQLLAAIGKVESGQARGGRVDASGMTYSPILGPQLNGNGFATIRDTDNGVYDGDTSYDRAVGPMQFIPSTWAVWGADGNGDGSADPHNIYDAALAAGRYLCAGGRDLSDPYDLDRAILAYNRSQEYLRIVRSWFAYFVNGHSTGGHAEGPDRSGTGPRTEPDSTSAPRTGPSSPSPRPRTGASPSSAPAPSSSPSPAPSPTRDRVDDGVGSGTESGAPAVTVPGTGIGLPDDGAVPGTGPLTSND
ncbi:lytic transglycosylase domain-containing protein [Streptomyces sp. NPDC057136]|uniref:lytic transglycosylase domain-containing protein n=1 Tax=Streptomyces sp. NPDC057136 TaxID=3346029 RepID=UPI003632815B